MTTLRADPVALDRAHRRVDALHQQLVAQQVEIGRQVDGLLDSGWSGAAATQFRTAWAQWCRGMRDLLAGIGLEGHAIELARAELVGVDSARADAARRLHERLGERLGAS